MNFLDLIMGLALLLAAIAGYRRGLISQLLSLAGLVLAYFIAYHFYKTVAPWLVGLVPLSTFQAYSHYEFAFKALHLEQFISNAIAFALLFFGVKICLSVLSRVLNLVAKAPVLNGFNRWTGLALAASETVLLLAIAVNVMSLLPSDNVQELLATSRGAAWIMERMPHIIGEIRSLWNSSSGPISV